MKFLNLSKIAALFAGIFMAFGVAAGEHPGTDAKVKAGASGGADKTAVPAEHPGADAKAKVEAGAEVEAGDEHPGDDAEEESGDEHPGAGS